MYHKFWFTIDSLPLLHMASFSSMFGQIVRCWETFVTEFAHHIRLHSFCFSLFLFTTEEALPNIFLSVHQPEMPILVCHRRKHPAAAWLAAMSKLIWPSTVRFIFEVLANFGHLPSSGGKCSNGPLQC